MKPQTNIIAWLVETVHRMSLKSGKFFQIFQIIGLIAGLITGIPVLFEDLERLNIHIELPEWWLAVQSRVISAAAAVMWFMAKLPVSDPKAPVNSSGETVNKAKALPFTAKNQSSKTK